MESSKVITLCALIIMYLTVVSTRMITLKEIKHCDPDKKYGIELHTNSSFLGDIQLHDWVFTLNVPLDDTLGFDIVAGRNMGNKTKKMGEIKSSHGACSAIIRYGGEVFLELANIAGLRPSCPITQHTIHIEWYPIDLDLDIAKALPIGEYQATVRLPDAEDNDVLCVVAKIQRH